jgi:hypothetical protein
MVIRNFFLDLPTFSVTSLEDHAEFIYYNTIFKFSNLKIL